MNNADRINWLEIIEARARQFRSLDETKARELLDSFLSSSSADPLPTTITDPTRQFEWFLLKTIERASNNNIKGIDRRSSFTVITKLLSHLGDAVRNSPRTPTIAPSAKTDVAEGSTKSCNSMHATQPNILGQQEHATTVEGISNPRNSMHPMTLDPQACLQVDREQEVCAVDIDEDVPTKKKARKSTLAEQVLNPFPQSTPTTFPSATMGTTEDSNRNTGPRASGIEAIKMMGSAKSTTTSATIVAPTSTNAAPEKSHDVVPAKTTTKHSLELSCCDFAPSQHDMETPESCGINTSQLPTHQAMRGAKTTGTTEPSLSTAHRITASLAPASNQRGQIGVGLSVSRNVRGDDTNSQDSASSESVSENIPQWDESGPLPATNTISGLRQPLQSSPKRFEVLEARRNSELNSRKDESSAREIHARLKSCEKIGPKPAQERGLRRPTRAKLTCGMDGCSHSFEHGLMWVLMYNLEDRYRGKKDPRLPIVPVHHAKHLVCQTCRPRGKCPLFSPRELWTEKESLKIKEFDKYLYYISTKVDYETARNSTPKLTKCATI